MTVRTTLLYFYMFVLVGDQSQTMTVHTKLLCFYSSCVLRRLNTDNNCPHHILVFLYGCVEKRLNTGNNCSHHILVFLYICVGMRLNTDNDCPYHIVLFLYDDCCVGRRLYTNVTLCPGQTLSPPVILLSASGNLALELPIIVWNRGIPWVWSNSEAGPLTVTHLFL